MNPADWTVLLTGLLTAVATSWAVWQRARYNPKPDWEPNLNTQLHMSGKSGVLSQSFTNVGDGAAYNVRARYLDGRGINVLEGDGTLPIAKVDSGDVATIHLNFPATGGLSVDPETLEDVDSRQVEMPASSIITISWTQPPGRRRRSKSFRLPAWECSAMRPPR